LPTEDQKRNLRKHFEETVANGSSFALALTRPADRFPMGATNRITVNPGHMDGNPFGSFALSLGLQEHTDLPALRFRQVSEGRHCPTGRSVRDDPEKRARSGILNVRSSKRRNVGPALSIVAMTRSALTSVQLCSCTLGLHIGMKRILSLRCFGRHFLD
jgi:hypothetical protein